MAHPKALAYMTQIPYFVYSCFCFQQQMGLVGGPEMADIEQQLYGDLGDDDELEAELLALQCEDTRHGGMSKYQIVILPSAFYSNINREQQMYYLPVIC